MPETSNSSATVSNLKAKPGTAPFKQAVVDSSAIKDDFLPKDDYFSPIFERAEVDHLWPRVWQIACRIEEIPQKGDFVTYDIGDDSIIVVRVSEQAVAAYHNACPHRGRQLTEGCGHATQFTCRFHGWRWSLDGVIQHVVDEGDWNGALDRDSLALGKVNSDTWGGWVWINMDLSAGSLRDFLSPVIAKCEKFEFEKLRFRWYKTVVLPVNWKVVLEAFDEGYHVSQTHAQLLPFVEDYTNSKEYGPHSAFWTSMQTEAAYALQRAARLGGPPKGADYRKYVLDFVHEFNFELRAMVTPRAYKATQRLLEEVSADASQEEVLGAWGRFQREAAEAEGAGWPEGLNPEYVVDSHIDWHIFPNTIYLHGSVDGVLWYRSRPNGRDSQSCIFDVWSLERYAPGKEPPLVREYYTNWRDAEWGRILTQDFLNIPQVYKGMKSRGFKGSRTNPVQERSVVNFHRSLHRFIESDPKFRDAQKAGAV